MPAIVAEKLENSQMDAVENACTGFCTLEATIRAEKAILPFFCF